MIYSRKNKNPVYNVTSENNVAYTNDKTSGDVLIFKLILIMVAIELICVGAS